MDFPTLLAELRRRKVVRVGAAYAAAGFVVWQAAAIAFPALQLPDWTLTFVVVGVLLGFPLALVLAWAFDLRPEEPPAPQTPSTSPEPSGSVGPTGHRRRIAWAGAGMAALAGVAAFLILLPGEQADLPPQAAPADPSIAVFPFENLSPDPDQDYLSDGITEELIGALGRLQGMRVAPRSSSFALKGSGLEAWEVGGRLRVSHVLEGSVRRSQDRIRVSAHLVDVDSRFQLWSEVYDRSLEDLFAVQEDIARSIVDALHLRFATDEESDGQQLVRRPTESMEAWELYLKGRYFWDRADQPGNHQRAVEHFEAALELDSTFALAHVGLADAFSDPWWTPVAEEYWSRSMAHARRAVNLDSTLAGGHNALAYARFKYEWDWEAAEEGFRKALALDPDDLVTLASYGALLTALGRVDEAVALHQRARDLDPVTAWVTCPGLAFPLLIAGDVEAAEAECRAALILDPTSPWVHEILGSVLQHQGRHGEAVELLERAVELGGPEWQPSLGHARALAGDREGALEILRALQEEERTGYVPPLALASLHLGLGNLEAAVDRIEEAHAQRHHGLVWAGVSRLWDPLRGEPRFQALLRSMGLEDVQPTQSGRTS